MAKNKDNHTKFSVIGIVLGIICILISLNINSEMAIEFQSLEGKTRAFIGLFELRHTERYYYGLIGLIGLVFAIISMRKKEKKILSIFAISISTLSIIITFLNTWRYF